MATCMRARLLLVLIVSGCDVSVADPSESSGLVADAGDADPPATNDGQVWTYPPGVDACWPWTCKRIGVTCGMAADGCGKQIDCGKCPDDAGGAADASSQGCVVDADCAAAGAGYVCQQDTGQCTKARKTRTKTFGTPCTTADTASGVCNCLSDPFTGAGYCTSACRIGTTTSDGLCPHTFLCMTAPPSPIRSATVPPLGNCYQACTPVDRCKMSLCVMSTVGTVCVP
jgi:hypothetical protein